MKKHNLCWVGQRVSDVVGFLDRLEIGLIISCDYGQTGEKIRDNLRIPIISNEQKLQYRKRMSVPQINDAFGAIFASREFLLMAGEMAQLTILPYANRPSLEHAAEERDWQILGAKPLLRNTFGDKRQSRAIFQTLNIPLTPCRMMAFRDLEAELSRRPIESPLVVKHPFSDAGSGIYLVREAGDLSLIGEETRHGEIDLLVEPYVDSYSINVNAVATPHGTIIAPVSLQIIGADECPGRPFRFCGNDFASASDVPNVVKQKCYEITDRLGELMAGRGYTGVFGVDFIANSQRMVFPVEINARFQNSTQLADALLAEADLPTLAELHTLAYIGGESELRRRAGLLCDYLKASQLIIYNRRETPFVRITGDVLEGAYSWDDDSLRLERLRDALSIRDCREDEILIGSSLPPPGFIVERATTLCRIQSRQRFLSKDLRRLRLSVNNCALALERDLALEAVE